MFLDPDFPIRPASDLSGFFNPSHADGRIRFRPRSGPDELDCWIYRPLHRDLGAAPVIAVHGIRRQAREQVELLSERARIQGRVIIAPIFDIERWPRYQQAVIKGRADKALLRLIDQLGVESIVAPRKFIFAGFSGGAQFVHRFAMLYPQMVERLIVSSAGWYTFPDATEYPYGLSRPSSRRALARIEGNLDTFLRIPITVTIGKRDDRQDPNTRSGEDIDSQQGRTRLERAENWARALQLRAAEFGIASDISLVTLARCGHSFRRCVRRGGLDALILPAARAAHLQAHDESASERLAA